MPQFDRDYYEGIWPEQGIHRHDYCTNLAERFIEQYGRCRILDIGTGCGKLVAELRDRGCDAWGLEISEYALANSCSPAFVRSGSVTDIPFASDRFDVVHSQGLWEYIAEGDIQAAWAECQRVGKIQEHNIDYAGAGLGEEGFITSEPKEWWDARLSVPRVLVGCPNHIVKEYAFQCWIDNVKQFTFPGLAFLVVDNSPNYELMERYGDQVSIITGPNTDQIHHDLRITQSLAVLQQHFIAGGYDRWFNCESDVLPPSNIIEVLLKYGGDSDWISHSYPLRNGLDDNNIQQGIGCSLLSRRLAETFDFNHAGDNAPDGWLWAQVRPDRRFTTMEMWYYVRVEHLIGPGGEEWVFERKAGCR